MARDFFEDYLINKLYGIYLLVLANEYETTAIVIYGISKIMVKSFIILHLIPKRIDSKKLHNILLTRGGDKMNRGRMGKEKNNVFLKLKLKRNKLVVDLSIVIPTILISVSLAIGYKLLW